MTNEKENVSPFSLTLWVAPIFLISLGVHFFTALFSEGFHHTDEQNQVLEYAYRKWNGPSAAEHSPTIGDWAYDEKIRSWALCSFFYVIKKGTQSLGYELDPFTMATVFRIISSLISFLSMIYFVGQTLPFIKKQNFKLLYILLSQFLWFIPYIMARTSSENFGFSLFAMALGMSISSIQIKHSQSKTWGLIGLLMGFSFLCRFQMIISIGFFALWFFLFRPVFKTLISWCTGFVVAIAINVLLDYWGYGTWTFSPWNYFYENIINGKADWFGVTPWWHYFTLMLNKGIAPLSIGMMILVGYFWLRNSKHLLTWITFPFLFVHCAIGHKELRFLFPLFLLTPLLMSLALEQLSSVLPPTFWTNKMFKICVRIGVGINCIMLIVLMFRPAHTPIGLYKYLYYHVPLEQSINVIKDNAGAGEAITFPYAFYMKGKYKLIPHSFVNEIKGHGFTITRRSEHTKYFLNNKNCQALYTTYPLDVFKYKVDKFLKNSHFLVLWKC